ncbi:MAG: 23S rRNA (uracil(1939)-C(5))-methyltransferase RlmD [Gemmatimonadetes bacterium]|nr:23S rRNA (uracil(1939)-C(5))-methyltransferase RlmD [Gemmatimonadota bacterium]
MSREYVKPKPGGVIEVDVDGLSVKGHGMASYGEYRVTIRGTVPGDTVIARLRKVRHRRREAEARVVDRTDASLERQEAACNHFGLCGGCLWQDLTYDDQILLKERVVREAVQPADDVEIGQTLRAPSPLQYRNKMEFSFGTGETGLVEIGLHPAGQFGRIFDLGLCELVHPVASEMVEDIRVFANERGLSVYDLKQHLGLLRFLTVRYAAQTGEVMVILTTSEEPFPLVEDLAIRLVEKHPDLASVVHTINRAKAQVAYGDESRVVCGKPAINDRLEPFMFEISPASFFQPNTFQAERMFERVVDLADLSEGETCLDAYCGTGGISLFLSQMAARVVGVEVSEDAIRDAVGNSARNGVENCQFISGPAEDLLGQLRDQGDRFDVAVTDPPRAGMHHRALRALIDLKPERIIYVSCNPAALATDAAALTAHGYRMEYLQLVDMLPQTPHCEVLVRFCLG